MQKPVITLVLLLAATASTAQGPKVPPLSEYLMSRPDEVALARSAAPANIADASTVKVLTAQGFEVANEGRNGFVCLVLRGWAAPTYTPAQFRDLVYDATVRAPICFDPVAVREVLPYYELRSRLGMQGKSPDEIARALETAQIRGELPLRDRVSFAYMWSADQHLGPGIDHWHPHMMVFAPYYDNTLIGAKEFGAPVPQVTDDAGTAFTVVVIPVADGLAVRAGKE